MSTPFFLPACTNVSPFCYQNRGYSLPLFLNKHKELRVPEVTHITRNTTRHIWIACDIYTWHARKHYINKPTKIKSTNPYLFFEQVYPNPVFFFKNQEISKVRVMDTSLTANDFSNPGLGVTQPSALLTLTSSVRQAVAHTADVGTNLWPFCFTISRPASQRYDIGQWAINKIWPCFPTSRNNFQNVNVLGLHPIHANLPHNKPHLSFKESPVMPPPHNISVG